MLSDEPCRDRLPRVCYKDGKTFVEEERFPLGQKYLEPCAIIA